MKTRPLNKLKYGISTRRYRELYYFCLQYPEWKDELNNGISIAGSVGDGQPGGSETSDTTAKLAIRRAELESKCKLLERIAEETDKYLAKYILRAATDETCNYNYLRTMKNIPCGRGLFYRKKREFYWRLSREKI